MKEQPVHLLHVTTVPISLMFFRGQLRYMRQRGFEPHAVSSPDAALHEFGAEERTTVHEVEMTRAITPLRDVGAIVALIRVMRRVRPTIVHAHTPKGGLLGMLAAAMAGVPVRIYHIRGLPLMTASGPRRVLLRATEWVACALAHRVLCVSHSLRDIVLHEGICAPEKVAVLGGGSGNGVDAEGRFNPEHQGAEQRRSVRAELDVPARAPLILFVGRIVRDKGIAELEAAWQSLRSQFPDVRMLLVGPLEHQDRLPNTVVERLRADSRVRLVGMQADVARFYSAADLLVLPTYREGFPNVVLEAGAMELPVVTTRVPGCQEAVVDGETGILVPPRDARALGDAIRRYLSDPVLRRRHGAAARARTLELFRPSLVWSALYEEYRRLLAERGVEPVQERSRPLPASARE